jgi:hypothetical protein
MTASPFMMLLATLSLFAALGCTSAHKPSQRVATIELHDSSPIMLSSDSQDSLLITASVPPASDGGVYRQVLLYVESNEGVKDSILMQTVTSGVSTRSTSTFVRCRLPVSIRTRLARSGLSIGFEQGSIMKIHPVQFISRDTSALTLTPFIRPGDEESIAIGVNAARNRMIEGEYLPSSEDIRVVIRSGFKTIWQSNQGMAFLTVITPVRPESVGEVSIYVLDWDGTDTQGQPLAPGQYTADIIIPARPAPYQTQITFTWPLKKN